MQIAMEVLEVSAPELSVELAISEAEAGWMLMKLIPWALARCPDHLPPSESDVVEGASAARKVAKAVGWVGDADELVAALERLRYAPVERVPGGIRIRGLDRYDAGWGSNHRELWAEWKAFREGKGPLPCSRGTPSVNTEGKHCPDADADADAEKPLKTPAAAAPRPPVVRISKPADPRLAQLRKLLEADYANIRREPYKHGGEKDTQGLKGLLPLADDLTIRRRWIQALEIPRKDFASCSTFAQLGSKWTHLAAPSGGFDPDGGILKHDDERAEA